MNNHIDNLRNNILESLQDIDCDRYIDNTIDDNKLERVYSLVRAFVVESYSDNSLSDESIKYMSIVEKLVIEKKLFNNKLYEGFYNPFDDDIEPIQTIKRYKASPVDRGVKISRVKLWDNNTTEKIYFENGKMFAGKFFGKGDTIEICPVRLIHDEDLYSKNIRDISFTIDSEKRIYAIPFGYASYYRNSKETTLSPNADYELIPNEHPTIRIYATSNIKKGQEIVLVAEDEDFQNEIKPGQFEYHNGGEEPYHVVKNYKII